MNGGRRPGTEGVVRELIVNADDFGLDAAVNEAIERAHRNGILASASLMVSGRACGDAVKRARDMPSLRVGLHVVLTNGRAILPARVLPAIVDASGCFRKNLLAAGIAYFLLPAARAQLEAEVRAQFQAFAETGLQLDHVNAQNHMHVHPTVLSVLMKVGREFGARAVRLPREPFWPSWRAAHTQGLSRLGNSVGLAPWLFFLRRRLQYAGFVYNDYLFGMNDTGHVTAPRVCRLLDVLPAGVTELYVHPATHAWPGAEPPDYDFAGELAALIDPEVIERLQGPAIRRITFSELAQRRAT